MNANADPKPPPSSLLRALRAPPSLEPRLPWLLRGRIPPQVRGVPVADLVEGWRTWYPWVFGMGFAYLPVAAAYALRHRYREDVADEAIVRMVEHGPFAKQLREAAEDEIPAGQRAERWESVAFVADPFPLKPGMQGANTRAVFATREGRRALAAVKVDGAWFTPDDGANWSRAKVFAVWGMIWRLIGVDHTRTHFPMDTVWANARRHLPEGHVLSKLLRPHGYLQQCVDHAVLYNVFSILRGHWWLPAACFPCDFETTGAFLSAGWAGLEQEPRHFEPYRYPLESPGGRTPYQRYLGFWFDALLDFVTEVVRAVPRDDVPTRRWAEACAAGLPGFPDPDALWEGQALARALTGYIHAVSIEHHVDHAVFSRFDMRDLPGRLRVPPPRRGCEVAAGPLATRLDVFRHRMAWRLYYRERVFRRMVHVRYGFGTPALEAAERRWQNRLREADDALREQGIPVYVPASALACSLQG